MKGFKIFILGFAFSFVVQFAYNNKNTFLGNQKITPKKTKSVVHKVVPKKREVSSLHQKPQTPPDRELTDFEKEHGRYNPQTTKTLFVKEFQPKLYKPKSMRNVLCKTRSDYERGWHGVCVFESKNLIGVYTKHERRFFYSKEKII